MNLDRQHVRSRREGKLGGSEREIDEGLAIVRGRRRHRLRGDCAGRQIRPHHFLAVEVNDRAVIAFEANDQAGNRGRVATLNVRRKYVVMFL